MVTSQGSAPVICSFRSPELTDAAAVAVIEAGATPQPMAWNEVAQWNDVAHRLGQSHCSALICDAAHPDGRSVDVITTARERRPWMPVLLYIPSHGMDVASISMIHGLGNVHVVAQYSANQEHTRLIAEVRKFIGELPANRVIRLMMTLIPDRTPTLQAYLRNALGALECGNVVRVHNAARGLKVSVRTLQRRLHGHHSLYPKEILDWATLIYTALLSHLGQEPVARIFSDLGLTSHDLYRLRNRLAAKVSGIRPAGPDQALPAAVDAFGRRCEASHGASRQVCREFLSGTT